MFCFSILKHDIIIKWHEIFAFFSNIINFLTILALQIEFRNNVLPEPVSKASYNLNAKDGPGRSPLLHCASFSELDHQGTRPVIIFQF